ncbi:MAG TPA: serine/threonine-protein kinase, partial [Nannocystaceae bacterium]|nr:serine/threonine-protein kinase [Nannocystaceae bacterium]
MDEGRGVDDALAATMTGARGAAVAPAPRKMFGRYLVMGALGKGGMGEVFTAYDPELDRKVALKRVQVETIARADRRARLLREAQAMAKIRHPNVIAVFDVGQIDDEVFIAMELVDGETLRAWLRREHTTTAIVEAFLQAARGLAAAHELGLVHRDFKPDNVMVDRSERVQVLDFGLVASSVADSTRPDDDASDMLTRSHATVGTPAYMAPEQHAGTGADELSDQFALCVALFEGLHGARPFRGETLHALATAVLAGAIVDPAQPRAIPRWLDRAVRRGLAVAPGERWPSMRELIAALEQGLQAERRSQRRWLVIGAVVLAGGAGALALAPDHACDDATRPVDDVWSTSTRERLSTAFSESPTPRGRSSWPAIDAAIEARAEAWRAGYRQVCEAARAGDRGAVERADRARVCLHGQTNALASALEVLAIADGD